MRLVFYLIILFLPTQLGRHFWPWWSYVAGLRIDYLSPTIYGTDILIGILFVLWLSSRSNFFIANWKFPAFVVFLLIGIVSAKNPNAGFYGLAKLLEFGFFGFYVANTLKKPQDLKIIAMLFSIGVLFESCLAVAQYVSQSSIGGMLYFLGERTFTSQTPGIANASLNGQLILRPYGTFPHPNVLAGYLVISMMLVSSVIPNLFRDLLSSKMLKLVQHDKRTLLYIFSLILGTIALFLSMSRVAIILWVAIVSFWIFENLSIENSFQIKNFKLKILSAIFICSIGGVFLFSPLGFRFFDNAITDESFIRRKELATASVEMIKKSPLVGVGLMNFLPNLSSHQRTPTGSLFTTIQPVHNIYLLVLAETGIIGFCFFTWFLKKTYQRLKTSLPARQVYDLRFIILSIIIALGFFDHYFLTLQQGQLLLAFVLGMVWASVPFSSSTAVIFIKSTQPKHTTKI